MPSKPKAIEVDATPAEFVIDLTKPPYGVPCPVCFAYALAPCRSERRSMQRMPRGEVPPGRVLPFAHAERFDHYDKHPQYRVKAIP